MERIYCEITKEEREDLIAELRQECFSPNIIFRDDSYPILSHAGRTFSFLIFPESKNFCKEKICGERYFFFVNYNMVTEDNFDDYFNSPYKIIYKNQETSNL